MSRSLSMSLISSKSDNSFCRICYSFSSYDLIQMPCKCKSTIGYVHRNCLRRWIRAINRNICEICHTRYTRNIVIPRKRSFKESVLQFIDEPLMCICKFTTNFLCCAGVGFLLVRKLFILYEPFEREMVDVGDITVSNIKKEFQFLNIAILATGVIAYIHLAKLTMLSLRELLATLHDWWARDRYTFRISNAYVVVNNENNGADNVN